VVHVALEASVIDTRNRRVFVQSDTITIDGRHPQRYHDYTIELPVEGLAVDDYLVTVKATTPTGAQEKTLRFSRR
jgi:hypothetical protein